MTGSASETQYSIGEVAELAHISVRTLHHYDSIGLLCPSQRTGAGHRRYTPADLHRLRGILFYRELEFGLDEIASMLAAPDGGNDDHLRRQHRMLRERIQRHQHLLTALEKEMEARSMGISLTPQEQFEVFGTDQLDGYRTEAEQRWGDTEAWRQSQRRTAAYTKDDWVTIKAEADANTAAFAEALDAGEPAGGERARALAEDHRQHICRWFYDCGYDIHRGIAQLYVTDPRYGTQLGDTRPVFAQYVHEAIVANADARG